MRRGSVAHSPHGSSEPDKEFLFDFNSSGFPPNLLKSVQFHSSVLSGSPNFSSFSSAAISTSSHPHLIPQHQDGTSNPCSPSTLPHNPNHHRRLNNIYHDPPPLLAHQHRSYGNDDNSAYAFLRRTIECSCGRRYNRQASLAVNILEKMTDLGIGSVLGFALLCVWWCYCGGYCSCFGLQFSGRKRRRNTRPWWDWGSYPSGSAVSYTTDSSPSSLSDSRSRSRSRVRIRVER